MGIFGFMGGFISGTVFGIYITQHYDVPDIMNLFSTLKESAKKYEKKELPLPPKKEDS